VLSERGFREDVLSALSSDLPSSEHAHTDEYAYDSDSDLEDEDMDESIELLTAPSSEHLSTGKYLMLYMVNEDDLAFKS
jgi:hypothetical protein